MNETLEIGDYITTCDLPGYVITDDFLHNYTVAKITIDCDFNPKQGRTRLHLGLQSTIVFYPKCIKYSSKHDSYFGQRAKQTQRTCIAERCSIRSSYLFH